MPACKTEAHRALELLEDYYSRIEQHEDEELKFAIERVIKIFKSRLFQALLDIQEFYEWTLLDSSISTEVKTSEAIKMVNKWEGSSQRPFADKSGNVKPICENKTDTELIEKSNRNLSSSHQHSAPSTGVADTLDNSVNNLSISQQNFHHNVQSSIFEFEQIFLDRGSYGLGFSIAGGTDNPIFSVPGNNETDSSIYITKLIPGGAASLDKRLQVNDVVLSVNGISVVNVAHNVAVDALKKAGNRIVLEVKRVKPHRTPIVRQDESLMEVELSKGSRGLGFTIAGGIGNQHIPGDNGIYVTKIMDGGSAAINPNIEVGDRLVCVKNHPEGEFYLDNCTHDEAVIALKKCRDKVVLVISKCGLGNLASPDTTTNSLFSPQSQCSTSAVVHPRPSSSVANHQPSPSQKQSFNAPYRSVSDEDNLGMARYVTLRKSNGLGFNIVGGEDGEGIFISFILAGGPADVSGQIRRGDKILEVNGIDLTRATHEKAASILKNAGSTVNLRLLYLPEQYELFEAKIHSIKNQVMSGSMLRMSEKKSLFVRTLCDYDASRDPDVPSRGLSFKFGDILHVTNASDDEWWQARLLDTSYNSSSDLSNPNNSTSLSNSTSGLSASGIIPSRTRWARKMKSRERNVSWVGKGGSSVAVGSNGMFQRTSSRLGPSGGSMKRLFKDNDAGRETNAANDANNNESSTLHPAYELVQHIEIDYARPVIILGWEKDRINDELIMEFPLRFGSCVPHTTRECRASEVHGRDYFFVSNRFEMESDIQNHRFIEAGQYNGNLYGTSIASVKEVAEKGQHCILDVSGNAIKRLQAARLYPVAILVRPSHNNVDKSLMDRINRLESDFLPYFTGIIVGHDFSAIYEQVKSLINCQASSKIWVPAGEGF